MNVNLTIFKNRNFLFYWLSGWISSLGDAVFVIALTWMLVEKTGSPAIVGSYLFVLGVTKAVFVLFGGVIVDRMDSRKLMIRSDVARAIIMFAFFMAGVFGNQPLWLFYVVAVTFGTVESIAEPAGITSGTKVVKKDFYSQAISLLIIAGNLSAIIGPVVGAGIVYLGGTNLAILINGISFVISALLLSIVRFQSDDEEQSEETPEPILASLTSGIKYFFKSPVIRAMAIQAFFTNAAVGATVVAAPFLAKQLGYGVNGYGLMNTGIGIGSAIGAIVFSVIAIRNPKPYMTLLTVLFQGIFVFLIGLSHPLWLIIGLFIIVGVHEAAINVVAPSVNHAIIPPKMFARVLSVMILIMSGSMPFSQAIAGWLMEFVSPMTIFIGCGLLEMAAAVGTFMVPAVRHFKSIEDTVRETVDSAN
ncbi:MAG TPA: MFS transporter [Sporolactobacillaceae bacterium]|nr:MFS transporter [Sporolactobacillaceae bacterium]